ncbi:hypothetical protein JW905_04875, partial [bacterium]|nr:hypothetical protein [candidate division CSSED10-310 bacterium]
PEAAAPPLQAFVTTHHSFQRVPFTHQTAYYRGENQRTAVLVLIELDPRQLTGNTNGDRLEFEVELFVAADQRSNHEPRTIIDELHSFSLLSREVESGAAGTYIYDLVMALEPGRADLKLVILDRVSHAVGGSGVELTVPSFSDAGPVTSTPLLIKGILEHVTDTCGPLCAGGRRLIPAVNGRLGTGDHYLYIVLYNLDAAAGESMRLLAQLDHANGVQTIGFTRLSAPLQAARAIILPLAPVLRETAPGYVTVRLLSGDQPAAASSTLRFTAPTGNNSEPGRTIASIDE